MLFLAAKNRTVTVLVQPFPSEPNEPLVFLRESPWYILE